MSNKIKDFLFGSIFMAVILYGLVLFILFCFSMGSGKNIFEIVDKMFWFVSALIIPISILEGLLCANEYN